MTTLVMSAFYPKSGTRNAPQTLRPAVRPTDAYSDFKRFDLSTVGDIRLPAGEEQ